MRVDSAPDQQHVAQRGERRAPVGSQLREERAPRGRSPSGAGGDSTKLPVRSQRHKGELPIGSGPTCARAGLGQRVGSDRLSEIDFLTGDRKLAVTMVGEIANMECDSVWCCTAVPTPAMSRCPVIDHGCFELLLRHGKRGRRRCSERRQWGTGGWPRFRVSRMD
ncbi:hypothetical protein SETIT_7G173400v2 [Setaria italica]|uniref:Uncharacterized protein n=2 Tax=Setaria TaxID=4554 RepID=A0A368RWL8_SETIT|nr:uncharacterized protein LOC101773589 isoform X2 [Setaria italica]XP_034604441.1 uncharacterized protein LOC117864440 isoform X2 [Setaria viridis]RCV34617.1 hypothetical protein SETIT_7G173400v2 [Setaria italica]TKW05536.1 hypothetical protein SEVIR_7G183000v2 [Setaria viridis]